MFVIQSEIDHQIFTINQKIIDSSALLKNICDITEITNPISVKCPGESLNFFITLINNTCDNDTDTEFEKNLFNSVATDKKKLIKLIQDLCILDSDIFLDSVSDYILSIIGNVKEMEWKDIQEYLGLKDDFSKEEREFIKNEDKLEYFLSINTKNFDFPFANKNLYLLKTDFSTPMNALIARIVERSDANTSFLLSIINKTLKNEVDRHPLKVTKFRKDNDWVLTVETKMKFFFILRPKTHSDNYLKTHDDNYFNVIRNRKIITEETVAIYNENYEDISHTSLDFIISSSDTKVHFRSQKSIYRFDVKKCIPSFIRYGFDTIVFERNPKFQDFFDQLFARDVSKRIVLSDMDPFKFFYPVQRYLNFYKYPNVSKISLLQIDGHKTIRAAFKNFVTDFMEEDGIIATTNLIKGIPVEEINIVKDSKLYNYNYPVSVVKKYLECIITKST